jgi:tRNA threonylcarbamoyladenosine biosynthesis protein TsaB
VLILGIETATVQVGCAIGGHEGVLASTHSARGKRHAESLAPAIEFTCKQARVSLSEIGVVAVDLGPGLFTGLRVGIATAKAIAQALRVPMIGVSSLDLLAFPARFSPRLIAAVLDARRGEVYAAVWRAGERVMEPTAIDPAALAARLPAGIRAVGDGAVRFREQLEAAGAVVPADGSPEHRISAVQVCRLGAAGDPAARDRLVPDYRREPDAQPPTPP